MSDRVLVTDGDARAALAIVRSLGATGRPVEVVSPSGRSLAGASRYCRREHAGPDPLRRQEDFAARMEDLCRDRGIGTLLPVTDAALLACLPLRGRLQDTRLPFPDLASYEAVSDKLEVWRRAQDLGIAVPRQIVLEAPDRRPPPEALPPFPLVVKPARSVVEEGARRRKTHVAHARDPRELSRVLADTPRGAYPLLLQERVEGTGEGVFLLVHDGRALASFAHRRLREKPPTGGVSVYRESVPLDPDLRERSTQLLASFDWRGVAMVEYKRSSGDGRPYLMEVNGRFWGSLQLAVDAGVDFPRLLVELAEGRAVAPVHAYRSGVRSRWWMGDLDHLLIRLRGKIDPEALPPGSGGRLAALFRFLLPWRPGDRSEVMRAGDPRPAMRELASWIGALGGEREASDDDERTGVPPEPAPDERVPAGERPPSHRTESKGEGRWATEPGRES